MYPRGKSHAFSYSKSLNDYNIQSKLTNFMLHLEFLNAVMLKIQLVSGIWKFNIFDKKLQELHLPLQYQSKQQQQLTWTPWHFRHSYWLNVNKSNTLKDVRLGEKNMNNSFKQYAEKIKKKLV